jgi:cyclic beta-1,2-glucan synthetase
MPPADRRLVIAFFTGNDQSVKDVAATMRRLYPHEKIELDLAAALPSSRRAASQLRMPDEGMLSAWLPVSELASAIQTLQSVPARSIFLTGGGLPAPEREGTLSAVTDARSLLDTLTELERWEAVARDYLVQSVGLGHPASPAAQWTMDNAYLVQLGIKDIRHDVGSSLGRIPPSHLTELLVLSKKFLNQTGNRVTDELLRDFLTENQLTGELDSEQLWSFPLVVRAVLIDELVVLSCRCSRVQQLREEAFLWADRIAHSSIYSNDLLNAMIHRMEAEPFAGDRSFTVALAEQLQEQETPLRTLQASIESRLGSSLSELVRAEHQRESEDSLLAANAFGSLRTISQIKYRKTFETVSRADAELWKDPSGIYGLSDFNTRDLCRRVVSRLSRRTGIPESKVARAAVSLSEGAPGRPENQLLYYLLGPGIGVLEQALQTKPTFRRRTLRSLRKHAVPLYAGSIGILTACFTFVALNLAWDAGIHEKLVLVLLGSLAAFPLSELAMQTVNSLVVSIFPPECLPKMDFHEGIPEDAATLVVIPMLLTDVDCVKRELEKLEIRFLANRLDRLTFSLFSDFTDAPQRDADTDDVLLAEAKRGIAALNRKYGENRFVLFHRVRSWSESEQSWIGWERKRGKIEQLNALLVGEGDPSIVAQGTIPNKIHFVITLDADTQLPPGAALRMIETISHPMNRVIIDEATGIRRSGYTIIQPRVSIALPGASTSRFTQIFSDAQGTDPYSFVVSDAHQELFAEAMFHGKALYDVAAFHKILNNRFPPETLLSHDLIEGAHVGVALASDIEVLETLPVDYPSFAARQHRWIRGDWQIAPWATGRVSGRDGRARSNPLSIINRWRILDNLRRSIVPMASLLLLIFGWFVSAAPAVWTIVLGLAVVTPALVPVLDRWSRHLEGTVYGWRGAADDLKRALVALAFLPHQAWLNTDAIVRALHRRFVSRRRILEWQTAADESRKTKAQEATMRQMMVIAGCSTIALIILAFEGAFGPTFLFLGLWITAPWLMNWLGQPASVPRRERIGREDTAYLRGIARSTWRYFDDLVGPSTNWLPPDNSQLALRIEVAQRTSPTNIGLLLNAFQAARDFGYLTTDEFIRRSSLTFETIGRLERYEGHLLNWYDTRLLTPLPPRYISTVDSGNLIASLWVMARGCDELADMPVVNSSLEGLADSVELLRALTGKDPSLSAALDGLRLTLRESVQGIDKISRLRLAAYYAAQLKQAQRWQPGLADEKAYWALKLTSELESWIAVIDRYLRWMELLSQASDEALFTLGPSFVQMRRDALRDLPSLRDLANGTSKGLGGLLAKRNTPELRPELATWLDAVHTEYQSAKRNAAETLAGLRNLSEASSRLASEINMAFLYDPARRLFGIGYTVGSPMVFSSHYDLLASECRVASLVAIAKGEVPVEHWFVLGRPRIATPSRQALLSWSGTMFEYLMPALFTETFENSLLAEAVSKAVDAQVAFGAQQKLPWGVSECAYSALDSNQIYQYRAFGIRDLALNPDADAGPVIAPYATALALMIDPIRAVQNLRDLEKEGATGSMGFYDAIDYTRPRREGKPGVVIFTYMVHHQAMTLLALSNALSKRPVQRRFHADPRIRAVESLLCERIPITRVEAADVMRVPRPSTPVSVQERIWTSKTALPHVHLNSNGRYSLMVTNNGGGYSRWKGIDITRWRSDTARDSYGSLLWIRDLRGGPAWTPYLNSAGAAGEGSVTFTADRAEFRRQVNELGVRLDVAVATDDDAELRRLTISNRSLRTRQLEITSYMELALGSHAADCAHPAFAKMFVETEAPERCVLMAHRRQRSESDEPVWVAHVLTGIGCSVEFETDRAAFLGRGRDVSNPAAIEQRLSGDTGAVLDPIFSFRTRCSLEPRQHIEMAFVTLVAASREDLITLVRKYQAPEALAHAFEMVWTRAQLEFRYLRIGPASAHRFEELAGHLLYPSPMLRPNAARLARNNGSQADLWKYGISGDLPILMVTASDLQAAGLVRELILAQSYLRMHGLEIDLVIMNHEEGGYQTPLHDLLTRLVQVQAEDHRPGAQGGKIFLLNSRDVPERDRDLLLSTARAVLGGHLGPLQQQLLRSVDSPAIGRVPRKVSPAPNPAPLSSIPDRLHFNGIGGFSPDGREYVVDLGPRMQTPAPWANVLANENFGSVVTESGLGFTWNGNSQRNRLTPWHNDPVADPQSEVIYLRDDETGVVWTPTPLPVREPGSSYRVRHGQGYSSFEHNSQGIEQELTVFVALEDPVKICLLRLTNQSSRPRSLTVTHFVEWVLGSVREQQQVHVKTRYDEALGVMLAQQTWNSPYNGDSAFCSAGPVAASYTADRIAFYGGSSPVAPGCLDSVNLDRRAGGGLDPCSALQVKLVLPPGAIREVVFVLGQADSEEKALKLAQQFRDSERAKAELAAVRNWWDDKLGVIQVSTPLSTTDLLVNRWLLYQSLACRFWGRSALYQSGGAIGFRDQLQDCVALAYAAPDLTRQHILRAAARQFTAGDVQHWWHAESGMGVRTRCSDDMLWLPWVVARYIERTGDIAILEEPCTFLEGQELAPSEHDRLSTPAQSANTAQLWEHCRLAIERASQFGAHGLPLFGDGDWNDGMNLVGAEGRGESVWVAWFLLTVLNDWISLSRKRDPALANIWAERSVTLRDAIEKSAWDGDWYLRGFFDDGSPLGSKSSQEAQIDSIAQSWCVLSGPSDHERAIRALASAEERLVHPADDLIQLLAPPFDVSTPHPGYIMGYPPGVRENGGQYTHAALWLAQARARLNDGSSAVRLLQMLNPAEHTISGPAVLKYRGEPYAVAADVSFSPGRIGRSGWTWYTGSAAWMYRIWLEDVLGFQLRGDRLRIAPAIPAQWPGFELKYRYRKTEYRIRVTRGGASGKDAVVVACEGKPCEDGFIQLVDDGAKHEVTVTVGSKLAEPAGTLERPMMSRR